MPVIIGAGAAAAKSGLRFKKGRGHKRANITQLAGNLLKSLSLVIGPFD